MQQGDSDIYFYIIRELIKFYLGVIKIVSFPVPDLNFLGMDYNFW